MELIKGGKTNTTDKRTNHVVNNNLLFQNIIEREWLSTEEAAEYLRLSANALRIMVHRGKVVPHRMGRRLRFKPAELDALIKPVGV